MISGSWWSLEADDLRKLTVLGGQILVKRSVVGGVLRWRFHLNLR
jgi:hypothetical protein